MTKLFQVGKALLNGNFNAVTKTAGGNSYPLNPSTYGSTVSQEGFSFSVGEGDFKYFKYQGRESCTKAYRECPGLNAVINKKAQAFINGEVWILDSEGKEAQSSEAKMLRKLLKRPNILQTWEQFEAQAYIYTQSHGYCPVLAMKPVGYTRNIDATALWNIPPECLSLNKTRSFFRQKKASDVYTSGKITIDGDTTNITLDDLCILRDLTVSTTISIFPDSRIISLEMPINNQIGALESRNVLINYRGSLGIFSRELGGNGGIPSPPVTKDDKEQLQKDFKRYGLRNNQWQFIITSANIKWQSISVPTKDLMLFEEVKASNEAICDKYGYPFELLANESGTTFANRKDAGKDLYQNTVQPEAKSLYSQLNEFFDTETYGIKIDKDYSKVPILQQDEKEKMLARLTRNEAYLIEWDNNLITLNQWRVANGEDPIPGEDYTKAQMLSLTKQPLVASIGVGGVQGIIALLSAPDISQDAVQATLQIVFGISPTDAAQMAVKPVTLAISAAS